MNHLLKLHFVDSTKDIRDIWKDINENLFTGMLRSFDPERVDMMNEKSKNVLDVLCPWACSEFCLRCADFDLLSFCSTIYGMCS